MIARVNPPTHPIEARIESRLEEWKKRGLISEDQAIRIADYEAKRPSRNWIASAFITLGVVVIGIGIISLVAANWSSIPDAVKLAVDFLLLLGIAGAVHRYRGDAWILLFILLCLATIGLIAQVFNTGGELYEALLLWSIVTLPIVLLARHRFVAFLWSGFFLAALELWLARSQWLLLEENHTYGDAWVGALLLMPTLIALLAAGFNSGHRNSSLVQAFRSWVLLAAIPAVGLMDLLISGHEHSDRSLKRAMTTTSVVAALAAWRFFADRELSRLSRIAVVSLLMIYVADGWVASSVPNSEFLGAFMTLTLLVLLALHFGLLGHRRIFHALTFLVGWRFLILYFQALGGLAATGIGLIASGGFMIGLVWAWNKSRPRLQKLLEDLVEWNHQEGL